MGCCTLYISVRKTTCLNEINMESKKAGSTAIVIDFTVDSPKIAKQALQWTKRAHQEPFNNPAVLRSKRTCSQVWSVKRQWYLEKLIRVVFGFHICASCQEGCGKTACNWWQTRWSNAYTTNEEKEEALFFVVLFISWSECIAQCDCVEQQVNSQVWRWMLRLLIEWWRSACVSNSHDLCSWRCNIWNIHLLQSRVGWG